MVHVVDRWDVRNQFNGKHQTNQLSICHWSFVSSRGSASRYEPEPAAPSRPTGKTQRGGGGGGGGLGYGDYDYLYKNAPVC